MSHHLNRENYIIIWGLLDADWHWDGIFGNLADSEVGNGFYEDFMMWITQNGKFSVTLIFPI